MEQVQMRRPEATEYAPYHSLYVDQVPDVSDVRELIGRQMDAIEELLSGLSPERWDYRYAEGKWSVREILGHLLDAEWVFAHRAIWIARGIPGALVGFEQDDFLAAGHYGSREPAELLAEFRNLRSASQAQFGAFRREQLDLRGEVSGSLITVRAILYILAGHFHHHVEVLKSRYLTD